MSTLMPIAKLWGIEWMVWWQIPLIILLILVIIFYVIYFRATTRSIGAIGMGLTTALLGAAAWVLVDVGIVDFAKPAVLPSVLLVMLASVISVGLSWSHLRNRLSGQIDSNDITNPQQPLV